MRRRDLTALLALGLSGFGELPMESRPTRREPPKQSNEAEMAAKKGLKAFEYPGGTIYALNQANADRKAKAKGFI